MGKLFFNSRSALVISSIVIVLILMPAINLRGEDNMVPKDPVFSRQVASFTGVGVPFLFSMAGLIVNASPPDNMNIAQATLLNNLITTMGLLIPPVGNFHAGNINKALLITYGASNAAWLLGMTLYYRAGLQSNKAPTIFEIILIVAGYAGRYAAGIWDWYTVTETVLKRNYRLGSERQKGFGSYYTDSAESRFGLQYSWKF